MMGFVKIAKTADIPPGSMIHAEAGGVELCIANVGGTFYAIGDRCGHENARISRGSLMDTIVTCPMHSSQFDVTTGKLMSGPVLELGGMAEMFSGCPDHVKKKVGEVFGAIADEQRLIKTYDQPVYTVKIDGSDLLVKL
jgi:nitrite reductase/ring-hydroxylating ferredoxin subunit